ncbi:ATP-dependent Lon protease [Sporosarcina sp. GW1-11]|uniref:ATP-dependent Lon protease n=1 Tax=Sporosarcina sp. GW1-11 TaxID=2899126 RepID=UPI00294C5ABC|nr:ATP-dependent Lon protease [Sporosarcina sp. GW1-11]MDV6377862.1 ATP-dependent Lon protease [Sporosarcina sp. GW1-11]
MKLFFSIVVGGLLGILALTGPIGIFLVCTIIVIVIFRSFLLLVEIHKHVVPVDANDHVKDAYERYMIERAEKENSGNE